MRALLLAAGLACVPAQQPELLADIHAGSEAGVEYGIAKVGSLWVFRGRSAAAGEELFTCAAPGYAVSLLRDVSPGGQGSSPEHLTVAGGRLFFFADDGSHGLELWVSDGTAAGTTRVADIRPGPNPGVVIDQYRRGPLTALGGSVFFVAAGRQLAVQAAVGPTANLPLPVDLSNGVLLTFGR